MCAMLRRRGDQRGFNIQFQKAQHLRIAILLHDINTVVLLDEFVDLSRKRISAQPQIIGLDLVLVAKLVAAFDQSPSAKFHRR